MRVAPRYLNYSTTESGVGYETYLPSNTSQKLVRKMASGLDKTSTCTDNIEDVETPALQYSVFSKRRKRFIVGLVALAAWFSTLSSFIYYPAISLVAKDLHLSITDVNLSITTYMAMSAIAPSILGDASDIYGRRLVYVITLSMYLIANIGIATQSSFSGLLLLRMLQSAGISGMHQ